MNLYDKYVRRGGDLYALWPLLIAIILGIAGFALTYAVTGLRSGPIVWPELWPGIVLLFLALTVFAIPFYYYTARILRIKSTLHEALLAVVVITLLGFAVSFLLDALLVAQWVYLLVSVAIDIAVVKKVYDISWLKSFLFMIVSTILIMVAVFAIVFAIFFSLFSF